MATSEVARLRERLEAEHRACVWALQGLSSGTTQHQFITARFRRMDVCCVRLEELVGEEATTTTLCEILTAYIHNRRMNSVLRWIRRTGHEAAHRRAWAGLRVVLSR